MADEEYKESEGLILTTRQTRLLSFLRIANFHLSVSELNDSEIAELIYHKYAEQWVNAQGYPSWRITQKGRKHLEDNYDMRAEQSG